MLDKSCESNQLRSGFQLKMVVSFVRFVGMEIGLKCKCVESNYRGVYCVKNHTWNTIYTNMSIPKWEPNVNSLSPFMCKSIYSSKSGEYIFNYLFRLPLETPRVFLTRQSKVGCVRNEAAERCLHHSIMTRNDHFKCIKTQTIYIYHFVINDPAPQSAYD